MIPQPQALPAPVSQPFYRQYIALELGNLTPVVSIQVTSDAKSASNFKSKLDLNWPTNPQLILDANTFYYITFCQPFVNIYDVLPEPKKYNLILNELTPLSVHISNRTVYMLMLGGRLIQFQLGSKEVVNQYIGELQNVGCVYSIQTLINNQKKPTLRIIYEHGGLKFYQQNGSGSFLSNLLSSLKSNNFRNLIPIYPNNLLGFVVTNENELKMINLYTKQLMDCDPINLDPNINLHLLNLRFATRVVTLRKAGFVTFLMCLFESNGSMFKIFKIQVRLTTQVNKLVDLDDFINGNIGQRAEIKVLVVVNQQKQIQDITMGDEGVFICHKQHHNSPILRATYRSYSNILRGSPIEMVESQIFKTFKQDSQITDIQVLRDRVLAPLRFTLSFLNSNNLYTPQIYFKLMSTSAPDIQNTLNRLTTARWPAAYKFVGIISFQGVVFVVRDMSISLLVRNIYGLEEFENYYYETQVKPLQESVGGFEDENEGSLISRLSLAQGKQSTRKEAVTPIQSLKVSVVETKLERLGSKSHKLSHLYNRLFSVVVQLTRIGRFQEVQYKPTNLLNSMVRNTVLSQVRHTVRVISTLLLRLYPHSNSDFTANDKHVISTLFAVHKLLFSPFKLYQTHFLDVNSSYYTCYDMLTYLVISEGSFDNSFSFSSFEDNDYLKIIGMLFGTDLEFPKNSVQKDPFVSFNQSSELLKFVVKQAEKNVGMRYYVEMLAKAKPAATTEFLLKAYLIAEEYQKFSSKILALAILPEFSCKFLKGLLETNVVYRKGRALLEYLSSMFEERMKSQDIENFTPLEYKPIIEMLLMKCDKVQLGETVRQSLRYMNDMSPQALLNQFLDKKRSLSSLTKDVKASKDPAKTFIFMLQLYRRQCQLFNQLLPQQLQPNTIRELIRQMILTLKDAVQHYRISQNIKAEAYDTTQQKLLKGFQPYIFGRMPSSRLLQILRKCHTQYTSSRIIEFKEIPYYFMRHILKGRKDDMVLQIRNLLKYFTEQAVIKALVANTSANRLLPERDVVPSLGGYGALNYYRQMGAQNTAREVMEMISREGKQYRSLEKQSI